ncbi:MAG: hypothetical protein WD063_17500 [Pirellulales bacterium]
MDALVARCAILAAAAASLGAGYRTPNFIIEAPTRQMAEQIGGAAEKYRRELAVEWLGKEMPNWAQPCPITAHVANHLGAGGATSFVFENSEVFGWRMTIQGSLVRILDSVLPHEVTHTVFATHFRQPLPRWADEGACTTVEHASERAKQQNMLIGFLRTGRGIAFSQMFVMREYPHDVMPLYSQGYSVARFLVSQGGKRKFLDYLSDGLRDENWTRATKAHYGFDSLRTLQDRWLAWVKQGSPALNVAGETPPLVAVKTPANAPGPRPGPDGPSIYDVASTRGAVSKSSASSGDTWHARGLVAAGLAENAQKTQPEKPGPAPRGKLPGPQYQVTRPQEFQRPRQVILEWSRPPGDSTSTAARPLPGPG